MQAWSSVQRSAVRASFCIAAVLAASGCGDSTGPATPTQYLLTLAEEHPVAGGDVIVVAQLADANGNPVSKEGTVVNWSSMGKGAITPTRSSTGPDGRTAATLTTDTLVTVENFVEVFDSQGIRGVKGPITTVAGPPATYIITRSTTFPVVGSTISVTAQIADRYHNITNTAGRVVSWNSTSGGTSNGSFTAPTSVTNNEGKATNGYTVGLSVFSYYQITVVDNQNAMGSTQPFFAQAAAVSKFAVTSSVSDPPAGAQVVIAAQATDTYGNPVLLQGRQVHWTFTGSGGSLTAATSPTDESGIAFVFLNTGTVPGVTYSVSAADDFGNTGGVSSITTVSQMALASMSGAIGSQTSCGISIDGSAWCWGYNGSGGLGNGTTADRGLPGKVGGSRVMTSLSAGAGHTCGVSAASVFCWGQNDKGQLGNGTTIASLQPVAINSTASFSSVSAGASHTCAVTTSGDAYCWGSPANGRLGDGGLSSGLNPVKVQGGLSFASVSAGLDHTCGLTTGGDAYCWGLNQFGKLGNGSATSASTPQAVVGGLKFTAIAAGDVHTCALSGGKPYCWGENSRGQLGTGPLLLNRPTPTGVAGSETFTAITAGGYHTCAIATDGRAYCWGDNTSGQLGDPTTPANSQMRSAPTLVAGGLTFRSIAAGGGLITGDYYYYTSSPGGHTCGVTTSGVTYCWGSNISGELGISPVADWRNTPTKVSGQ